MAKERYVNTKFWDDTYIISLDPSEKLLFLYLLTNPLTNIAGVYEITPRRISFDTGFEKDMVRRILDRFEADGRIKYQDGWVAIKNFIKHQKTKIHTVKRGIEIALQAAPEWVYTFIDYDSLSYLNLNLKFNYKQLDYPFPKEGWLCTSCGYHNTHTAGYCLRCKEEKE